MTDPTPSQTTPSQTTPRKTKPIPQEAFDWYDEYAHGVIDRREFLRRLATITAVGASVGVLTSALTPNYALADQISFNDPDILATYTTFDSPQGHGEGRGYLVKPKNLQSAAPAILVVHENRGLNPYIKDVARRVAKAGFIAFAPDALYPLGGYPGNDDDGRSMQSGMDRSKIEQDFIAATDYLRAMHATTNIGAVGFCFGGYVVNMLAAARSDLIDAGVPFYGTPAAKELWPNIKSPLMVQLAENDKRVNSTWPDYEKVLNAQNLDYAMHMYKDCQHGFHNDSTGRYNELQAAIAWERTLAFFSEHLT
ncbi:MAG: carboxymethylenebutenolidase [Candidatus Azotimanducaceae bacterium]|jgi:carboxymethylenebutenolidase